MESSGAMRCAYCNLQQAYPGPSTAKPGDRRFTAAQMQTRSNLPRRRPGRRIHRASSACRSAKARGMALLAGCCCKTPSDAALRPMLLLAECSCLKQKLPFMKGKPWVRHDEHYHGDFAVPCKPNAGRPFAEPDAGTCRAFPYCSLLFRNSLSQPIRPIRLWRRSSRCFVAVLMAFTSSMPYQSALADWCRRMNGATWVDAGRDALCSVRVRVRYANWSLP